MNFAHRIADAISIHEKDTYLGYTFLWTASTFFASNIPGIRGKISDKSRSKLFSASCATGYVAAINKIEDLPLRVGAILMTPFVWDGSQKVYSRLFTPEETEFEIVARAESTPVVEWSSCQRPECNFPVDNESLSTLMKDA